MTDIRHLRYFQAVAEELSFSRAARRLHVAQPALSRAVKELEHSLGVVVFERNRRAVRLTAAGAVLVDEASRVLERLDALVRRVRRTSAGEEGELRLGYIGPPTHPFLGRLLAEYRRRFPRVTVHLEERTPERVWEMVAKGRLSIGLTRPVRAHEALDTGGALAPAAKLTRPVRAHEALGLRTLVLRKEPLCLVVEPRHPLAARKSLAWRQLAGEPLIVLARREGVSLHDEILAACRRAGFTPRIAHMPSIIGTVLSYVEAGAGVGVVPDSVAAGALHHDLRVIELRPVETVPLVMVWAGEDGEPAVRAFRELVKDWLGTGQMWPRRGGRAGKIATDSD